MKHILFIFSFLICFEIEVFSQITEVTSFRKERYYNDNNSYPKAHPDGENRVSDFQLPTKVFTINQNFQNNSFLSKGHNVRIWGFDLTSPLPKDYVLGNNFYGYTGKSWEQLTIAELNTLAGDAAQTDIIATDFEYDCDWSNPNTYHNYAYLFHRIKQLNPNAKTSLSYSGSNSVYGNNQGIFAGGRTRRFTADISNTTNAFDPNYHKSLYNNTLHQVNPNWNISYSDCGNKTLWQLCDFIDVEYMGYDVGWVTLANGENGTTTNTAHQNAFLGGLNGFELIRRTDATKKIRLFGFVRSESPKNSTTGHSQTSEGSINLQTKLPIDPALTEASTFWSLWKGWGCHWWNEGQPISTNDDSNLTSRFFPNGAGQGVGQWDDIGYFNGTPNYNQATYNSLYGNKLACNTQGENYDEIYSGAHKYSQIHNQFGTQNTNIPTTIEYMRASVSNTGVLSWPSNYTSYTPPQNGAVYAEANLTKRPLVEYRQSGSSYLVVIQDLYPNNATNPTKIRITLGSVLYEFQSWGNRLSIFKVN